VGQATLDATVTIAGKDLPPDEVFDLLVEADLDQPDMVALTLANESKRWSTEAKLGDELVVKAGLTGKDQDAGTVFKGEVTGIEPVFGVKAGGSRVVLRGLNSLHKLSRGKKSATFTKMSDQDIVSKIAQAYSLSTNFGKSPPNTKYDHVYQHNQTDLEFIRLRAARIGFEVLVQDKTLYFRKRTDEDSGITLNIGESGQRTLERFAPRLSTANQVSEVRVRAWDVEKKQEIIGNAKPAGSKLGGTTGASVSDKQHSNVLFFDVDVPVYSKEEADGIAKSILQDRQMSYITGDAVVKGSADLKPGIIVTVTVGDTRFDGKYYVTAVRHRYQHEGPDQGFRTQFKFKRDAES
jgi:phage protein D